MKNKAILMAAVLAVLLLAGCSQQGQQQANNGNGGNSQPSGDNGGNNGGMNFLSIPNPALSNGYRVAYELEAGGVQGMQTVQYVKGKNVRMDAIMPSQSIETRSITNLETMQTINCMKGPQGFACYRISAEGTDTGGAEQIDDVRSAPQNFDITYDGTMQVAGTTANCFRMVPKNKSFASMKSCFSAEGVPLYLQVIGNDSKTVVEMQATSYSTNVADSEFEPPAAVQEIGLP